MVFSSLMFLFRFLPIVLLLYFAAPKRATLNPGVPSARQVIEFKDRFLKKVLHLRDMMPVKGLYMYYLCYVWQCILNRQTCLR